MRATNKISVSFEYDIYDVCNTIATMENSNRIIPDWYTINRKEVLKKLTEMFNRWGKDKADYQTRYDETHYEIAKELFPELDKTFE